MCDSKQWCENNIGGTWVQTYKDDENKNYAGSGMIYYHDKENFSNIQPSWTLDDLCIWQAPVEMPSDDLNENEYYDWNESNVSWDKFIYDTPN